jgi:hypothetical protein
MPFMADFWEFEPQTNGWTRKAQYSGTARRYAVGFAIGNKGYAGTGNDGVYRNDFWEYTPDGFRVGLLNGAEFCAGSSVNIPFTIAEACNSGNVFTAQISDSLGSFANPVDIGSKNGMVSDTISGTLPTTAANGYKYKIRVQSNNPVNSSVDNLYKISIYSTTVPGIVSGGTTISLGATTDTLRLSGNVGSILKWQKQLDGAGYADISSSTGLIYYIETPNAAGTWDYRAVVKNGACITEQSSITSVAVALGSVTRTWTGGTDEKWNKSGNWNPSGVPGATDDVIIPVTAPNMPVVKVQGLQCNNILIQNGAGLDINPGFILTINGQIIIEGQ